MESAPRSAYHLGRLTTVQVDTVHKSDGRVQPGGQLRVFTPDVEQLVQGTAYMLFLRDEVPRYSDVPAMQDPEPFRGTTLVSSDGQELALDPKGVYGLTLKPQGFPRDVRSVVPVQQRAPEELQRMQASIQQSQDRVPPTVIFPQAPRAVIRGTERLQVEAQDEVGMESVEFFAEHMEQGGIMSAIGFALQPPYSLQWDTTSKLDGRYRIWTWASDVAGNKSRNPPIDVVVDNTPPRLTVAATPVAIWPPDGNPVPVTVSVEIADGIDTAPRVRLSSIVANAADPLAGVAGASFGEDDRAFTLEAVPGREYLITYEAEDAAGNTFRAATMAAVNRIPTVSVSAASASCHPRPDAPCQIAVNASAADPDGDPLSYAWQGCASGSGTSASCSVTAVGPHSARVTVSDPKGAAASAEVAVAGTNTGPVVTASAGKEATCHPACTTAVSATATDADGDPLTYTWSGCAAGTGASALCNVTSTGSNTALVEVSDGWVVAEALAVSTGVNAAPYCNTQGGVHEIPHNTELAFFVGSADPDADSLSASCAVSTAEFTILGCAPGRVDVRASCYSPLEGEVTVTVRDPLGATGSCYQAVRCQR